jgi:hypothetical protein
VAAGGGMKIFAADGCRCDDDALTRFLQQSSSFLLGLLLNFLRAAGGFLFRFLACLCRHSLGFGCKLLSFRFGLAGGFGGGLTFGCGLLRQGRKSGFFGTTSFGFGCTLTLLFGFALAMFGFGLLSGGGFELCRFLFGLPTTRLGFLMQAFNFLALAL